MAERVPERMPERVREAEAAVPSAQESAATIDEDSMASSAERMTILRMVEQGKISAEDGARLLAALGERNQAEDQPRPNVFDTSHNLLVRVTDLGTNRQKVNVKLPVGLLQLAWRWLPSSAQAQFEKVQAAIDAGQVGQLIEVVDQDSGVRVEITLV
jgi:hypothetical protein